GSGANPYRLRLEAAALQRLPKLIHSARQPLGLALVLDVQRRSHSPTPEIDPDPILTAGRTVEPKEEVIDGRSGCAILEGEDLRRPLDGVGAGDQMRLRRRIEGVGSADPRIGSKDLELGSGGRIRL